MSLTEIQLNTLDSGQFSQSTIEFDCECVVDREDVITDYNIFWIEKGAASITIDFVNHEIKGNSFFFLNPGQIFSVASENKLTGVRIAFGENFYCPKTNDGEIGCNGLLFNNLLSSPTMEVDASDTKKFSNILQSIATSLDQDITAKQELVESYLKILLIECTEYKKKEIVPVDALTDDSHEIIRRFNSLVEEHYSEWHQIAPYAEQFGISPTSLTKKFSKLGVSPSKVIYDRLIIQAKRLLYFTDKQVKEIAYDLGFEEPAHFSSFFKNKTGKYPADFRKKLAESK
ncbi:MAG: AraC family transcriptional regulator [Cyclobacteriaceae bacterium]